jgi:hypothetical protein
VSGKELDQQIDGYLVRIQISERFKDWAIKYLHELQGHPQGCQLSGDHTPSLLSGRSWADKQGVSRAPA